MTYIGIELKTPTGGHRMRNAPTILGQVLSNLQLWHKFSSIVKKIGADRYVKEFRTVDVLKWLIVSVIVGVKSLRELGEYLRYNRGMLAVAGVKCAGLSTLSHAMSNRDADALEKFFYYLVEQFRCVPMKLKKNIELASYIMDGTNITVFGQGSEWAKAKRHRHEVRVVLLTQMGGVPVGAEISGASVAEITSAQKLDMSNVQLLVMDRGYKKYGFWQRLTDDGKFFITRAMDNMVYEVAGARRGRRPAGILDDDYIRVYKNRHTRTFYPMKLRLIEYKTSDGKILRFVTNNLELVADDIAELYRKRWEIETFFRFLKQTFNASRLIARSPNAVRAQIFAMLILVLLLHILKQQMRFDGNLFQLFRKISCVPLKTIPMQMLITHNDRTTYESSVPFCNSLF